MRRTFVVALASSLLLFTRVAYAVPGPDSVVVLANLDVPGSVVLAHRYADARDVPDAQVCILSMPTTDTISLVDFQTRVLIPLRACLGPTLEQRMEAIVVMRGVPMRVTIPIDGDRDVSITAALATWRSTLTDETTPLLGTSPGQTVTCGMSSCYAARVLAPYSTATEDAFVPGFERIMGGIHHRPILATMLTGYDDDDAGGLIDVALAAESAGAPSGEIVLMHGADMARSALDPGYDAVLADLVARGATASIVPFDADFTGHTLAGFAVGTSSIGSTIEANTYVRGALVDNLTSYGALPSNFDESAAQSQVSVARWIAAGVGGVHGTVSEPLNNSFPSRRFLVTYVDGATLAESYAGALPFAYWLNLIIGDPMLAPYAQRPTVTLAGASDGETLVAAPMLHVVATPAAGRSIAHLSLLVDGVEVASADGATLDHCLAIGDVTNAQILAVATTAAGEPGTVSPWPAKGWASIDVIEHASDATCDGPPDAGGAPDAGAAAPDAATVATDAATIPEPAASCACRATETPVPRSWWVLALALGLVLRARASKKR